MSVDDAVRFAEALDHDETLRKWVEATNEKVLEVARAAGYDITADELTKVMFEKIRDPSAGPEASTCFLSERPGR